MYTKILRYGKQFDALDKIGDLSGYYEDTIEDFLEQGSKAPTSEEFVINCYEDEKFDNKILSAWFEEPENPSNEEMKEFIEEVVRYFQLYKVLGRTENSRDAILKKELNKIYKELENEYISQGRRDYLEDKKDYILEQLAKYRKR